MEDNCSCHIGGLCSKGSLPPTVNFSLFSWLTGWNFPDLKRQELKLSLNPSHFICGEIGERHISISMGNIYSTFFKLAYYGNAYGPLSITLRLTNYKLDALTLIKTQLIKGHQVSKIILLIWAKVFLNIWVTNLAFAFVPGEASFIDCLELPQRENFPSFGYFILSKLVEVWVCILTCLEKWVSEFPFWHSG